MYTDSLLYSLYYRGAVIEINYEDEKSDAKEIFPILLNPPLIGDYREYRILLMPNSLGDKNIFYVFKEDQTEVYSNNKYEVDKYDTFFSVAESKFKRYAIKSEQEILTILAHDYAISKEVLSYLDDYDSLLKYDFWSLMENNGKIMAGTFETTDEKLMAANEIAKKFFTGFFYLRGSTYVDNEKIIGYISTDLSEAISGYEEYIRKYE